MSKLTDKQKKFKELYMDMGPPGGRPGPAFGNATKATKMAGYKCKNPGSYRVIGYENVIKLNIDEEFQKNYNERDKLYLEEKRKKDEIEHAELLRKLRHRGRT